MDGGARAQIRTSTVQQKREEVCAALQYVPSCHCLVDEWRDCEELQPKPQEKWTFVDKKVEAKKHRTGVLCGCEQTPLHEVWKKQQKDQHARNM